MEPTIDEKMLAKKNTAYQAGVTIFIILLALTIGEYALGAVGTPWWMVLLAIAVLKAFFVLRDYMHFSRLLAVDKEDNS